MYVSTKINSECLFNECAITTETLRFIDWTMPLKLPRTWMKPTRSAIRLPSSTFYQPVLCSRTKSQISRQINNPDISLITSQLSYRTHSCDLFTIKFPLNFGLLDITKARKFFKPGARIDRQENSNISHLSVDIPILVTGLTQPSHTS